MLTDKSHKPKQSSIGLDGDLCLIGIIKMYMYVFSLITLHLEIHFVFQQTESVDI